MTEESSDERGGHHESTDKIPQRTYLETSDLPLVTFLLDLTRSRDVLSLFFLYSDVTLS